MPRQEEGIKIVTLRLPEELHRRLKIAAVSDEISMQEALTWGLQAYLQDFKSRHQKRKLGKE